MSNQKLASTPAIAVTAYAGADDARLAIAAGFQIHLSKPIEASQLIRAIVSLVQTKSKPA